MLAVFNVHNNGENNGISLGLNQGLLVELTNWISCFQSESVQSRKADASWYYDFSEPIEKDRTRVCLMKILVKATSIVFVAWLSYTILSTTGAKFAQPFHSQERPRSYFLVQYQYPTEQTCDSEEKKTASSAEYHLIKHHVLRTNIIGNLWLRK